MVKADNINDIIDHKLFSEDDIHEMCVRLGKQLTEDYAGKKPLVVGALKGAIYFLTDLTRQMDVAHQLDFIDVSSYGDGFESTGKVKIVTDLATHTFDYVVIATGGHAGYNIAKYLGHSIIEPKPALVGLKTDKKFTSGVVLKNVKTKIYFIRSVR